MTGATHLPSWFWFALTRVGESEILLPAFVAGALWLAFARPAGARLRLAVGNPLADDHPARASAWRWLAGVTAATAVTTASKVAFLGYGIGSAALDFTGVSGHAMYAAAILPVLGAVVAGWRGALAGAALALGVMLSRVQVHAHSWSEVVAGAALGATVAWWTLLHYLGQPGAVRVPWWLPLVLAAWLTLLPWRAPPSRSHELVIALSMKLSGHDRPYTRRDLLGGLV